MKEGRKEGRQEGRKAGRQAGRQGGREGKSKGHLHSPVPMSGVTQEPTVCAATERRMCGFEGPQSPF